MSSTVDEIIPRSLAADPRRAALTRSNLHHAHKACNTRKKTSWTLSATYGPVHGSRVVLLAGPPCSGKTTYAAQHQQPGDVVLDYDEVYAQVTGLPLYVHDEAQHRSVEAEFRRRLEVITSGFIIRCAPRKQHRAVLCRIHHARSLVLEVPASVCLERLAASDRPEQVKVEQAEAIGRWWSEYERSQRDLVVSPSSEGSRVW